jgi:hypothetical protein
VGSAEEESNRKPKRDFIPRNSPDEADFSLRRPTDAQERDGKKRRRPASLEMTVWQVSGPSRSRGAAGDVKSAGAMQRLRQMIATTGMPQAVTDWE